MPPSSLRLLPSTSNPAGAIRHRLQSKGIKIPVHARGAYKKISLNSTQFQLYAWVWLPSMFDRTTWMLLVVLECLDSGDRPHNVCLRIQDRDQILVEQFHSDTANEHYLFAQILGDRYDQFQVTVEINDQCISLPSFYFEPDTP